jgi:hypothetical protein
MVSAQLSANLIVDAQMDQRAHGRYLQVMDRSFLHEYLASQSDIAEKAAGMNLASHVPTSQPYVVPNWIMPTGPTTPKG